MKPLQLILVIMLCACFSACAVVCTNPVSSPSGAKQDQRLLGRWMSKTDEGIGYVQFDDAPNQMMSVSMWGDKLKPDKSDFAFTMFTTRLGNYDYMNLKFSGPKGEGYFIVRYSVKGDRLSLWLMSGDKIKNAIAAGKLKGQIRTDFLAAPTITDSSKNIAALIQTSSPEDELFFYIEDLQKVEIKQSSK
jgi:hypothetical protein